METRNNYCVLYMDNWTVLQFSPRINAEFSTMSKRQKWQINERMLASMHVIVPLTSKFVVHIDYLTSFSRLSFCRFTKIRSTTCLPLAPFVFCLFKLLLPFSIVVDRNLFAYHSTNRLCIFYSYLNNISKIYRLNVYLKL